jgi:hypothetical protein
MGKIMVVISCVGMLLVFGHSDCSAFRCGDGFASIGDSKTKVMLECGKPTSKEKVGVKKDKKTSKESRSNVRREYEEVSRKPVEKWYYNCGDNDFIYVLTFEGSKLKKEDTEGYGKGKSDCKGR